MTEEKQTQRKCTRPMQWRVAVQPTPASKELGRLHRQAYGVTTRPSRV